MDASAPIDSCPQRDNPLEMAPLLHSKTVTEGVIMSVYEHNQNLRASPSHKCFVVASRIGARIFVQDGPKGPVLVNKIEHLSGRLHDRDLGTDRPGRSFARWSGQSARHALSAQASPHELELEHLTLELAEELKAGRLAKNFDDLILVAEPHFNGVLFGCLDKETKQLVSRRINKDLANLVDGELVNYLRDMPH
jgi:protein required for attachment to host cells